VQSDIMNVSSCGFQTCDRNSGCRYCVSLFAKIFEQIIRTLIHTHHQELMKSVGSHGSSSLLFFVMNVKTMVLHFVSDSHEAMTALNCRVTL
jgi:hypothetical protein